MGFAVGDQLDAKDSTYEILAEIHVGQTDVYRAHRSHDNSEVILKVHEGAFDEALTLAELHREAPDPKLLPYLPKHLHLLSIDGEHASALEPLDGFYNLHEVHDAYPKGIDPKDMAWMFRRLLVPLGFIAEMGLTHTAVLPQHVMIQPEQHGLVLIDWTHMIRLPTNDEEGEEIVTVDGYEGWYPLEVKMDDPIGPWTDIYMAANLMSWLMGGDPEKLIYPEGLPREIRAFITACTKPSWRDRPHDPHGVLRHFDTTLTRLYGDRKFHPFRMP